LETKLLLVKSITLLYRESQQKEKGYNSSELIRTVVETVKPGDIGVGINTEREIILALKDTVLDLANNFMTEDFDKNLLSQRLKVACGDNERLYDAFISGIENDLSESQLKRTILNLRKSIDNHFRDDKINEILSKASYTFRHQRDSIKDTCEFAAQVIAALEPLQSKIRAKDPAIVSDIDIGNLGDMNAVFKEIKDVSDGTGVMRTGWQALNRMTQGGFRRGEFTLIGALQHKYKTGFTLSIFEQLALCNKPYMIDPTKKPLLLRISFEDSIALNLQFMYQSLKYDETREEVDVTQVSEEEMSAYVQKRLQVNGYHIKMLRVDPTQWTYRDICNKAVELEAQGYEIHVLMLDYLMMVPTTGCVTSGPTGTDLRDLIRRVRNFFAPRKTAVITPHQLSPDAKQLLRGGLPEDQFVKEIAEKGYFSGSKQLDQELDLEMYLHIFKMNGAWHLAVQRGKHRLPTIVDEESKFFMLPFPKRMPIPTDLNGEDSSYTKVPSKSQIKSDNSFGF
jgi:hypothetical protein